MENGVHLEAKGKFDYVERRKLLAVLATNPGTVVHMVFMRNQKLGKGSKMTYGEWCDKHGIKWSVYPELPL
jgi:Phage endonuclease I